MIEPATRKAEVSGIPTPIATPPRVYYLPDAQGRMASYYNAMELPAQYTKNHGIPRTNHFIPVGYCCLEEIAPRPVSNNYRGKNPRNDYKPPVNASPALLQSVEAKVEERSISMEPRAPSPSPEQQAVKEAAPPVLEELKAHQQQLSRPPPAPSSAISVPLAATTRQPSHQPQTETASVPAQPFCPSSTCTHHTPSARVVEHHVPRPTAHVNHVTPSPLATRMPAICRRWLIGTCRRGAACRNRHYVLDETDAELCRIKESHLATVRFYNESRAAEAASLEVGDTRPKTRTEKQYVEAHVEGLGKVKIRIDALSAQLGGLKLQEQAGGKPEAAAPSTPALLISPAISATESTLEPLPDYTLSMPPVKPGPTPVPRTSSHNQQIERVHRIVHAVHPAERFRASYAPHHLSQIAHRQQAHPYSRRAIQQQDFVPRHVLDRALQQYIAGSLRGRRFLGPRPPSARKRAILAQMSAQTKDSEVEEKGVAVLVDVKGKEELVSVEKASSAVIGKEEIPRAWSDEVEAEVADETKVETGESMAAAATALLVDIARV